MSTSARVERCAHCVTSPAAVRDDAGGVMDRGSAYVFMLSGTGQWSQQAKLEPSVSGAGNTFFGNDIDVVREIYGILVRGRVPYSERVRRVKALAGTPMADEFIAFIQSSKRGIMTRHGRATSSRGSAAADDE